MTETDSQMWLPRLFHGDKLPMQLQAEAAECGIAYLAMVAASHGQRHTLSDLRRKFSASLKGTTLKSIMDMADGLGMVGRPLRLEVEETLRSLTCTRIFVAHREAAIEGADTMLSVAGGTVTDVTLPVAAAAQ